MNRRKGLILIAASTVAGVVCSAGIYSAVAANRHDPDKKADTVKTTATEPTATKTTKSPKKQTPVIQRTPTTPPPTKSLVLSVDNILATSSLTSIGYPVASSTRADGDLQYIATPCMKQSMNGLSGGNVFSGSWPTTDGGMVSETVTVAVGDDPANGIAETIVGWHGADCAGWVVGPHHRAAIAGGFTDWVDLTGTGDQEGQIDRVAVIKINSRIGVLGVSTSGHSEPAFIALLNRAVAALR